MIIVGGETSLGGAVIGAIVVTYAPEWLRFLGSGYLAVFSALFLAVLIFAPKGLAAAVPNAWGRRRDVT